MLAAPVEIGLLFDQQDGEVAERRGGQGIDRSLPLFGAMQHRVDPLGNQRAYLLPFIASRRQPKRVERSSPIHSRLPAKGSR